MLFRSVCQLKDSKSSEGSLGQRFSVRMTTSSFQNSNRKVHFSLSDSTWHPLTCLRISTLSKPGSTWHPLVCLRFSAFKIPLSFSVRTQDYAVSHFLITPTFSFASNSKTLFTERGVPSPLPNVASLTFCFKMANHPVLSSLRTTPGLILPTGDT